jgi:uncharacterized protein
MTGEKNLKKLLKTLKPILNKGDYVFCNVKDLESLDFNDILYVFKEHENITVVLKKEIADSLNIEYNYIASWITLAVHSSLEAVGLTAAFSTALAKEEISCNVVAAFYHDHIFVDKKDTAKAMQILELISK